MLCVFFAITLGSVLYMIIEGWSFSDAFYMTFITISTVGFREVGVLSPSGRYVTIFLIMSGLTIGAYALTTLTSYFVSGEVLQSIKGRRMEKRLSKLKNHIILAGHGKLGKEVARELKESGKDFCVMEMDPDCAESARKLDYITIEGDASDEELLKKAGVDRAVSLVAALTGDPANVMVVITARGLNPELYIVARGIDDTSVSRLKRAGADRIELPFVISGKRLTSLVAQPGFIEFIDLFSQTFDKDIIINQFVVKEGSPLADHSLKDLDLRNVISDIDIMAIERKNGEKLVHPHGDVVLRVDDRFLILGKEEQIRLFESKYKMK